MAGLPDLEMIKAKMIKTDEEIELKIFKKSELKKK